MRICQKPLAVKGLESIGSKFAHSQVTSGCGPAGDVSAKALSLLLRFVYTDRPTGEQGRLPGWFTRQLSSGLQEVCEIADRFLVLPLKVSCFCLAHTFLPLCSNNIFSINGQILSKPSPPPPPPPPGGFLQGKTWSTVLLKTGLSGHFQSVQDCMCC